MILSAIVILTVLAVAYMWGARGFFSALIHLVCTIVAGAVAFAAWEPLTLAIMNSDTSKTGVFTDWSFGLGLALPFAVTLGVLRLASNALIPKNVDLDGVTNMVGGGVCGAISGVITTGIFVLSLGYMRFETSLMGYEPITYSNNGSLVRTSGLILPTDRITAAFYSAMSDSTFRTEENLAKWHPDLADEGPLLRINFDDGKSRHVHKPGSFEVLSRYQVESGPGLFNDSFDPQKRRSYTYLDGEQAVDTQTQLEGFVVRFNPSANERSGRVIVGNGQLRLVVQNPDGTTTGIQPAAVISEADQATTQFARWPFETQGTFIATVGGRNETPMAFEFPVPRGSTPIALYVKGIRYTVPSDMKAAKFSSPSARDTWAKGPGLTAGGSVTLDTSSAVRRKASAVQASMQISDSIPFNHVLQTDSAGGLNIEEKRIVDGEAKFDKDRMSGRNADPAIQVRRFFVPEDQVLVHVIVDNRNSEWGFVSPVGSGVDTSAAPILVDENGNPYPAIGYVYDEANEVWISMRPDAPVRALTDMPLLSRSKPDAKLVLLFRVGKGQKIKHFAVGNKALLELDPGLETSRR